MRRKSTTKRLPLLGADGYRQPADGLRHTSPTATARGRRGRGAGRCRSSSWANRLVPGLPYPRPRPCTRRAARWRSRSTTCCHAAPGPACSTDPQRSQAAAAVAGLIAADLGWDDAESRASGRRVPHLVRRGTGGGPDVGGRPARSQSVTEPTAPIELTGTASRLHRPDAQPSEHCSSGSQAICETLTDDHGDRRGQPRLVAAGHALGARRQVPSAPLRSAGRPPPSRSPRCSSACAADGVPVTAAGGRSGVSGASVPVFGGVVLDITAMQGIVDIDATSGIVEVLAGTFGPDLEDRVAPAMA